jgi:fused signal recognition particle receptor
MNETDLPAGEEVPVDLPVTGDPLTPIMWGGGAAFLVVIAFMTAFAIRTLTGRRAIIEKTSLPSIEVGGDLTSPENTEEVERVPVIEPESLVSRMRTALGRSRAALQGRFDTIFGAAIDESMFEELEEALLIADVGMKTARDLLEPLRRQAAAGADGATLREALRENIRKIVTSTDPELAEKPADGPLVILVVGVNGSGKTTTIGKLAARYHRAGDSVLLAAADTFRAAASDQLAIWALRADADIVRHEPGADPGAVTYDALAAAKARDRDVVIVDTAGRLQTRKPLMEQLSKIRRVIDKQVPGAPHETLLVIDGTMGQNAMSQAVQFNEATPLTGVVVTKLDGTAKGGMILSITNEMGLPVKFIGIGEQVDDLRPFDGDAFVDVLA